MKVAEEIDGRLQYWREKNDEALHNRLAELKDCFRRSKRGYEIMLPDALGAIREASCRCLGLEPYPVQLAGALALYRGYIAEMATGEGKTLTAALTAVLRGWGGLPCHIVTVNDYLAERDAKRLTALYRYCGVSVGYVIGEMDPDARRHGYGADITYTTSKEIVADFLRDRLRLSSLQSASRRRIRAFFSQRGDLGKDLVMRGIHSAIIDEADSVLIDEAVTPLIISQPQPNEPFVTACRVVNDVVPILKPGIEYKADPRHKEIELLPGLDKRLPELSERMPRSFRGMHRCKDLIRQALTAREFFHRDSQYITQDKKVVIVDEFTGRLMPQRTWREGLHQLIEAKENITITPPSETLARLSFQRFFRFFHQLSGMTGTASEAAAELWHIYGLPVITIPLHRPCRRTVHPRKLFLDQESKWRSIVDEIAAMNRQERPVLIGTRSIMMSNELAARLTALGLPYRLLNALKHREEASIVAKAGERKTITVATNMAGRGTDIRLGHGVAEMGGLHVIATECHESARIDRQLFGRSARQGDPGSARSFVSLEDELIQRYLPPPVHRSLKRCISKESSPWVGTTVVGWSQTWAQHLAFKRRRSILKMDTWLDDSLSFAQGDTY